MKNKKCVKCLITKDLINDFQNNTYNTCKTCINENRRNVYKESKTRKESIINNTKQKRIEKAIIINNLKITPCVDCGKLYEPFLMDFDHLRDKIMPVSKMIHENYSIKNILKEIEKCELVCCFCHATRTYIREREDKTQKKYYNCYYRNLNILLEAKNKPCNMCNIQYEFWQMHFNHIDPSLKKYGVGALLLSSEKKLREEIAKCEILCVMCHRRKTKEDFWD